MTDLGLPTWIAIGVIVVLAIYVVVLCWIDDCPHKDR
jgi:hypothetical protein